MTYCLLKLEIKFRIQKLKILYFVKWILKKIYNIKVIYNYEINKLMTKSKKLTCLHFNTNNILFQKHNTQYTN